MKRLSCSSAERAAHGKVTRRERFPGEMERAVPWARLLAVL
jgi:IS5 family transposase